MKNLKNLPSTRIRLSGISWLTGNLPKRNTSRPAVLLLPSSWCLKLSMLLKFILMMFRALNLPSPSATSTTSLEGSDSISVKWLVLLHVSKRSNYQIDLIMKLWEPTRSGLPRSMRNKTWLTPWYKTSNRWRYKNCKFCKWNIVFCKSQVNVLCQWQWEFQQNNR